MKKLAIYTLAAALLGSTLYAVSAAEKAAEPAQAAAPAEAAKEPPVCFESRKGASEVTQKEVKPGLPNVKCSPTTGAALWYGDPYDGTVPMGKMPGMEKLPEGHAVVKPRSEKLALMPMCGTACHNGVGPQFNPPTLPKDKRAKPNPTMEAMVPDLANFQHGRGRIWCMDCHHNTKRNMLVDHFGDPVSFDQPQLLCGKCHGDKLRDWRDGIHGKRIGEFTSTGKKRWFTCTECHNPHNVQDGARNRGFVQLQPEPSPQLPKGMKDAKHELLHPIPH
ncbi:MAG: hypothetical protein HKUEN07_22590 [Rhodocyclaceae bacterium]|uniref:Cytochrome c7-like domain-containing protein n=1 Tax=Candidatus Desulfobacillus denitrificans TaxID=2608985 RepID=A0A809S013_9PROT|nr:conserved hypothetical protein [Candidatus Desulfobacillus denitrificans]GIK45138.1 MAG: hypothetical protein BroJett012_10410 [Betaproteobacteria bacterium]GJQ55690.1 MAG: hypothetical protein HKUEN07_22590 [Rhodocyclaceae bacterium]